MTRDQLRKGGGLAAIMLALALLGGYALHERGLLPSPFERDGETSTGVAPDLTEGTQELTREPVPIEPAPAPGPRVPELDLVRVEPSGDAIFAGRAEPEWKVELRIDGNAIGKGDADGNGDWVVVPKKPLPAGPHQVSLHAISPDGAMTVNAPDSVAVVVDDRGASQPIVALTKPDRPSNIASAQESATGAVASAQPEAASGSSPGADPLPQSGSAQTQEDASPPPPGTPAGVMPDEPRELAVAELPGGQGELRGPVRTSDLPEEDAGQAPDSAIPDRPAPETATAGVATGPIPGEISPLTPAEQDARPLATDSDLRVAIDPIAPAETDAGPSVRADRQPPGTDGSARPSELSSIRPAAGAADPVGAGGAAPAEGQVAPQTGDLSSPNDGGAGAVAVVPPLAGAGEGGDSATAMPAREPSPTPDRDSGGAAVAENAPSASSRNAQPEMPEARVAPGSTESSMDRIASVPITRVPAPSGSASGQTGPVAPEPAPRDAPDRLAAVPQGTSDRATGGAARPEPADGGRDEPSVALAAGRDLSEAGTAGGQPATPPTGSDVATEPRATQSPAGSAPEPTGRMAGRNAPPEPVASVREPAAALAPEGGVPRAGDEGPQEGGASEDPTVSAEPQVSQPPRGSMAESNGRAGSSSVRTAERPSVSPSPAPADTAVDGLRPAARAEGEPLMPGQQSGRRRATSEPRNALEAPAPGEPTDPVAGAQLRAEAREPESERAGGQQSIREPEAVARAAPTASDRTATAGGLPSADTQRDASPKPAVTESSPETAAQRTGPGEDVPAGPPPDGPQRDGAPDDRQPDVAIETVEAEDTGRLQITGRSDPGSSVRAYAGGEPVGDARADETGRWEIRGERPLGPGRHPIRADRLDEEDGRPTARAEVTFDRGSGEETVIGLMPVPTSRAFADDAGARRLIVQRGDSLWRISRRIYGDGLRFTIIYQANDGQIRDPDLIYPGQIFALPLPPEMEK
jgi:nucleoid-associated protein YgaU